MSWFVILSVLTCVLALGLPPDPQTLHQLHISSIAYRIAIVALLVPYGIIWYAAFYAFSKLKDYSHAIKGFDDGKAFRSITIGMGVLAFGLILPTTASLILQSIAGHYPGFKPTATIIVTYLGLAAALISFLYFSTGTHLLAKLSKNQPSLAGIRVFALLFIILASMFTYLVMSYHTHHNVYHLNTPFLITTFVIPSLFAWFIAFLSAYEFGLYAKTAKGLLYRQALQLFTYGIITTMLGSVANQFVNNTLQQKASHSLGILLVLDYILLAIYAAGLIMMALGTNKLKKIEEV